MAQPQSGPLWLFALFRSGHHGLTVGLNIAAICIDALRHEETALLAGMPQAQDEVGLFIQKHRPDVVIYDVGMPYSSSWDLLEVIRTAPALHSQAFVITTPNKRKLEQAVGSTSALEIGGPDSDLRRLLKAVEAAADRGAAS